MLCRLTTVKKNYIRNYNYNYTLTLLAWVHFTFTLYAIKNERVELRV